MLPTRLDRYLLREILPPFCFSLLLFCSLAVLSGILPSLKWVEGVRLLDLSLWIVWQYPTYIVQVLPIAMLFTVLLVVGRLVSTYEFLALMAAGISPLRLAAPFLVFALGSIGLALWVNQAVLPRSSLAITEQWWQLTTGRSGLWRLANQEVPIGRYRMSFARTDRRTDELFGVRLVAWEGRQAEVWLAERAIFEGRKLDLYGVRHHFLTLEDAVGFEGLEPPEILERLVPIAETVGQKTLLLPRTLEQLVAQHSGGSFEGGRSLTTLYQEASNPSAGLAVRREAATLFHRKLAEPMANLVLLLIAFPLSLQYARSRVTSFGLALLVALAWYLLLSVGLLLAQVGQLPAWLGAWGGNILLGGFGLYLLSRLRFRQ